VQTGPATAGPVWATHRRGLRVLPSRPAPHAGIARGTGHASDREGSDADGRPVRRAGARLPRFRLGYFTAWTFHGTIQYDG